MSGERITLRLERDDRINTKKLTEEYVGGPYPSKFLITEDWETQPEDGFVIPNSVLKSRINNVLAIIFIRDVETMGIKPEDNMLKIYEDMNGYVAFVELHRILEEWNEHPRICIDY